MTTSSLVLPLGPFDLLRPIGRGGMGEVWRGVHRDQAIPVAVKLLTADGLRSPHFRALFHDEVRAAASLWHPNIALVLDHGVVSDETATLSGGRLPAGGPYLAMELASGGSLLPFCGKLVWDEMADVLLCVLDALAHAHARGVVHLDVKPHNVLVCGPEDTRPGIKLADFGVAHAFEQWRGGGPGFVTGTPDFMAPEQLEGRLRDYGPWTDLFGFGRFAVALAGEEQGLAERTDVPRELRGVLARLLSPDRSARFQTAADAARALRALTSESRAPFPVVGPRHGQVGSLSAVSITEVAPAATGPRQHTGRTPPQRTIPATPSAKSRPVSLDPPAELTQVSLPVTWRRAEVPTPPLRLVGAGLGLYGLRAVPLVGREAERDRLWEGLRGTLDSGAAQVFVLHGAAGVGKSRLADWLCERAHEVGGAAVLRAVHGREGGPAEGLRGMLLRHLRCEGLTRDEVAERTERLLRELGAADPYEWNALTEIMAPASPEQLRRGARPITFTNRSERHVVIRHVVEREAQRRPVILRLDDVQWGSDTLSFVRQLTDAQLTSPRPILVVLTVRDDALAERPVETRKLSELSEAHRLHIPPLRETEHRELVRGLLSLEPSVAAQVEERTAGNPLFAVELVGDWVRRGVLEVGENGFRLRPGTLVEMPATMGQVWAERVERLLKGRPEADAAALELAAVLGQDVDGHEWRHVCDLGGVSTGREIVEALLAQRLARSRTSGLYTGFSFVHGMLREAILRRTVAETLAAHHRKCARMLEERPGSARERLGRHLLLAGEVEAALGPLLEGARVRIENDEYGAAEALLDEREAALRCAGVSDTDERFGEGWLARGRLLRLWGRVDEAWEQLSNALLAAEENGWERVAAHAMHEKGQIRRIQGNADDSLQILEEATRRARALRDWQLVVECGRDLGRSLVSRGELEQAAAVFEEALMGATELSDQVRMAQCNMGLYLVAARRRDGAGATVYLKRAHELVDRAGARMASAWCETCFGELARAEGDLVRAEAAYRRAIELYRSIDSREVAYPEIDLGLILVERGQYREARRYLEGTLPVFQRQGRRVIVAGIQVALMCIAASEGSFGEWDERIAIARGLLAQTDCVESDLAATARLAGDLARGAGELSRARDAYELSLAQWRVLGQADEAEAVETAIAMCTWSSRGDGTGGDQGAEPTD